MADAPPLLNALIIVLCIAALWFGADMFVDAAARLARRIGASDLVIGLTIVAMGTSAPEFAVSARAALSGQGDISVGNVVGSNIFNLGFILGTVAVIHAINTTPRVVLREGGILVASTLLLLIFMRDNVLSRGEGITLFVSLVVYLTFLLWRREVDLEDVPTGGLRKVDIPRLLIGLVLVILGGRYLVESSVALARAFNVSEWAIGVTIVAAGTSAPEAVTSIVAIVRRLDQISLGNLIGSNIFNVLGVLGFAGAIQPLTIDRAGYFSLIFLTVQMLLTALLMWNGWRLSRREGYVLLGVNFIGWIAIVSSSRIVAG